MELYRVLKDLSTGQVREDIVEGNCFKQRILEALIKNNANAPIRSPPLSEIPAWNARAEILEKCGIVTVNDFLCADDEILKQAFNYKTTRTINKWKKELRQWILPPTVHERK